MVMLLLSGLIWGCRREPPADLTTHESSPDGHGRLVALIVLDTVRRDHVEPCGDSRPITPSLQGLATAGTTYCGMVAPGSWTLPVHASMFTGRLPLEHGADTSAGGIPTPGLKDAVIHPLDGRFPTLAERFKAAGFQTVLVSGNPVLHPATGLSRGFDLLSVSEFAVGKSAFVHSRVRQLLESDQVDPRRPLFLFVNIIVAHNPYERVPEGVSWLSPTPSMIEFTQTIAGETLLKRIYRGEFEGDESAFMSDLRANYAWGVHLADEDLGSVLDYLRRSGWLRRDSVVAVTSDHGERLGERGRFGHGASVAPEVTHVFAVMRGPGFAAGRRVDSLNQSQDLFPTLLEAAGLRPQTELPDATPLTGGGEKRIAITTSEPDANRLEATDGVEGADRLVALESPVGRLEWSSRTGFDAEHSSGTMSEDMRRLALRIAARTKETMERQRPERMPPDLEKQLKALGYVN